MSIYWVHTIFLRLCILLSNLQWPYQLDVRAISSWQMKKQSPDHKTTKRKNWDLNTMPTALTKVYSFQSIWWCGKSWTKEARPLPTKSLLFRSRFKNTNAYSIQVGKENEFTCSWQYNSGWWRWMNGRKKILL